VFAPPPDKVVFATCPATLQDLEDGSTVLGLNPKEFGPRDGADAAKTQVFVPTGEAPDAHEVGYRQVNPMFESVESPDVIFRTLHKAMTAQDIEFSCSADWTVCCCFANTSVTCCVES
jgi:hypothetical protein